MATTDQQQLETEQSELFLKLTISDLFVTSSVFVLLGVSGFRITFNSYRYYRFMYYEYRLRLYTIMFVMLLGILSLITVQVLTIKHGTTVFAKPCVANNLTEFLTGVLLKDLGVSTVYLIVKPNEDTIGRFNKLKGRTYSLF